MTFKLAGALTAVIAGVGLLFFSQPSLDDRLERDLERLNAKLNARQVQIDPAELLDIINDNNIAVRVLDVRDEADFNLFHIIDSTRITIGQIYDPVWVKSLPQSSVIVLVSNDETRAGQAWKLLTVQKVPNLYLLAGGTNAWIDIFDSNAKPSTDPVAEDAIRYIFSAALGDRHPAANPDPHKAARRKYKKIVKNIGGKVRKGGGCG
ncbi:MAG: rhodanese-like domain-containing protein [Deltaproteobacteria bacterium]|nr:rhodanese-like domain-containing protein [Deltaproteobacteria bacterium]MBW1871157.1 rhodanese-like domain-containing protein [Deltaproteobacteria bacterium]